MQLTFQASENPQLVHVHTALATLPGYAEQRFFTSAAAVLIMEHADGIVVQGEGVAFVS